MKYRRSLLMVSFCFIALTMSGCGHIFPHQTPSLPPGHTLIREDIQPAWNELQQSLCRLHRNALSGSVGEASVHVGYCTLAITPQLVLTNTHVLGATDGAPRLFSSDNEELYIRHIRIHPTEDIALIHLTEPTNLQPVSLWQGDKTQLSQAGSPLFTFSGTTILSGDILLSGKEISASRKLNKGQSGSPVFTKEKMLFGINTSLDPLQETTSITWIDTDIRKRIEDRISSLETRQ